MTAIPPSYDIPEETVEKVRSRMNEDVEDIAFIFKVFVEVTNQRYLKYI